MSVLRSVLLVLAASTTITRAADDNSDDPWYMYASIPLISGVVGYVTNVIALKMTFYPLDFFGIPLKFIPDQPVGFFGWQGIIPAKAGKMAATAVDIMLDKLINVQEVFCRLDPRLVAYHMRPGMEVIIRRVIRDLASRQAPGVWEHVPPEVKDHVFRKCSLDVGLMVKWLLEEMKEDVQASLDVRGMVVNHFLVHKEDLVDMFQVVGAKEFVFIERSGFVFGFLFGLVQMGVWLFYPEGWVLPAFGFLVGWLTNWIALKMIFEPVEPVHIGPLRLQGLFLLRQEEVSKVFAQMNAEKVLNARTLWREVLWGRRRDVFRSMLRRHADAFFEYVIADVRPAVVAYAGGEEQVRVAKDRATDIVVQELPAHIEHVYDYSEQALGVEQELCQKMSALPSKDFEQVLHPVFQEDEVKLILVGAVLGVLVGLFQLYVIFKG